MQKKLRVAVLGATGLAGQQFLTALAHHPYFSVTRLCASKQSAGKRYAEALRDKSGSLRWFATEPPPAALLDLLVEDASAVAAADASDLDVVFSALDTEVARELEPLLARQVPVFSTASAYRYEDDVPILLPGVNPDHAALLTTQQKLRGWRGFIAPGPNCTTVGLAMTLRPLLDAFGLQRVVMTSLQAVSGAGRSPGVSALDILDNVIPYIPSEEEKVERETRKILGHLHTDDSGLSRITPRALPVSCTCTRVAVLEGHTEAVFVQTERPAPLAEVKAVLSQFGQALQALKLPSLPPQLISVTDDPFRPQPRLDRDCGGGLTTVVGRLRPETALGEHGVKYVLLSHNTKMGAAAGSILVAEQLYQAGYLKLV